MACEEVELIYLEKFGEQRQIFFTTFCHLSETACCQRVYIRTRIASPLIAHNWQLWLGSKCLFENLLVCANGQYVV